MEFKYEQAQKVTADKKAYESQLLNILKETADDADEQTYQELSFYDLGDLYIESKQFQQIITLLQNNQPLLRKFLGAKPVKIMQKLAENVKKSGNIDFYVEMIQYIAKWCDQEKRTYLKHKQEIILAALYLEIEKYKPAIDLIDTLLIQVRKNDDKLLLVEAQLLESKIFFALQSYNKAKASLTSARACANQVFCDAILQAELDLQGGIIFSKDKDYKTAYSYNYEAFEAFYQMKDSRAIQVFKYMILCKVMLGKHDDVLGLIQGKYGIQYQGIEIDSVKAVASAQKNKSIVEFQKVLQQYSQQLETDINIKFIIETLYDQLLEENLFKIIEPYSRVEIEYIAKKINLDILTIQNKLSELILDKKIDGTLDQGNGCLILFDDLKCDDLYKNSQDFMTAMDTVVDSLFERGKQIKH